MLWPNVLWVALGGAAGSAARYLVTLSTVRWVGMDDLPYGTLAVNVIGSCLLGALLQWVLFMEGTPAGPRLMMTTGLMGGFTTYSTFNYELLDMMQSGRPTAAAGYLALTVGACLAAGLVGVVGGRWLSGG